MVNDLKQQIQDEKPPEVVKEPDYTLMGPPKVQAEVKADIRDEKFDKLNLENIELQMQIFDLQNKVNELNEEISNVGAQSKSNHFTIIDQEIQKLLDKDISQVKQIQNLQVEMSSLSSDSIGYKKRFENIMVQNKEYESQVAQLQKAYSIMKDQYNDQANSVESIKKSLNSLLKLVIQNTKSMSEVQQSWLIQQISDMVKT